MWSVVGSWEDQRCLPWGIIKWKWLGISAFIHPQKLGKISLHLQVQVWPEWLRGAREWQLWGEWEHWENFTNNVDNNTGQNGSKFVSLHSLSLLWAINSLPTKWLPTQRPFLPFLPSEETPVLFSWPAYITWLWGSELEFPAPKMVGTPITVIAHAWHVVRPAFAEKHLGKKSKKWSPASSE